MQPDTTATQGSGSPSPPARILVPTDLTEASQTALEYALSLGERLQAHVDLLHVWQPPPPSDDGGAPLPDFVRADFYWELPDNHRSWRDVLTIFVGTDAGHDMMACLKQLEHHGVDAHGRIALGDPRDPWQAIVTVAHDEDYALIVMATHGRDHLLRRKVTEKVIRSAHCPVVTIRVDEASLGSARPVCAAP